VVVAIDFTGSNGDPRQPGTLHYMDPNGAKNDYEKAILSIMEILQSMTMTSNFQWLVLVPNTKASCDIVLKSWKNGMSWHTRSFASLS
jgi:hypothetical protein